jgi:hypothetical protein
LFYPLSVVTVFEHLRDSNRRPAQRGHRPLAVAAALVVGIALGYLGWALPVPGGSILIPTLIVLGVGLSLSVLIFVFALHPNRSYLWIAFVLVSVFTVAASFWTYEFSIPASVAWDLGATRQAESALLRVTTAPKNGNGVPLQHCWTIRSGSVGSIIAPFVECAISTFVARDVFFSAKVNSKGGLTYTNRAGATFEDECARHLVGKWWMYSTKTDGMGSCPFGYQFHGGG